MALIDFLAIPALLANAGYHAFTAFRLWRWSFRPTLPVPADLPPVTIFRPMKRRVRDVEGKLRAMKAAARDGDQLLAGFDPGCVPEVRIEGIEYIECPPQGCPNPKISKLITMSRHAAHEHWLLIDSEAMLDRALLDRVRTDWLGQDAITAGYRFTPAATVSEALDHAPALLSLWPGLMVAKLRFMLGACTGVLRKDVAALGGWEALGDFLAEDYQLGRKLSALGKRIVLSRAVLPLESDQLNWGDWFRHQVRVAMTYRVCEPAGWAGAVITYSAVWALLVLAPGPHVQWRLAACAGLFLLRFLTTISNGARLGFDTRTILFSPLAYLAEPIFWAASWVISHVWWGPRRFAITPEGRIQYRPPQAHDRSRAAGA